MELSYQEKEAEIAEFLIMEDEAIYRARCGGKPAPESKEYRLIELFCGAGGMSLGFSQRFGHPFRPVWANDNNDYCVETYNRNFGDHCIPGDIVDILRDPKFKIPKADVVIGGPPCQGFSLLNKNRDGDPRKQLWRPFMEVVERSKAQVFVMENVPHLLGTLEHGEIIESARQLKFKVWQDKLMAADYGVPQRRLRAFIIGCRFTDPRPLFPPRKTHYDPEKGAQINIAGINHSKGVFIPDCEPWRTVKDSIGDLPEPDGTEINNAPPPMDLHFGRKPTQLSIMRYKAIPDEGMNRFDLKRKAPELTPQCWIRKKTGGTDLFGRLWWNRPAYTIRTEFFKPEKGRYLHPEQHRPITHREAARLQSFPDDFIFAGSKIEIAKQIGNAVPPILAARIGDVVRLLFRLKP
jgi:DNA (cytosine-5)-methyltransferase 1